MSKLIWFGFLSQAQKQVFNLMKFDSYSRFLKSTLYQECLDKESHGAALPFPGDETLDPLLRIYPLPQQNSNVSNSHVGNFLKRNLGHRFGHNSGRAKIVPVVRGNFEAMNVSQNVVDGGVKYEIVEEEKVSELGSPKTNSFSNRSVQIISLDDDRTIVRGILEGTSDASREIQDCSEISSTDNKSCKNTNRSNIVLDGSVFIPIELSTPKKTKNPPQNNPSIVVDRSDSKTSSALDMNSLNTSTDFGRYIDKIFDNRSIDDKFTDNHRHFTDSNEHFNNKKMSLPNKMGCIEKASSDKNMSELTIGKKLDKTNMSVATAIDSLGLTIPDQKFADQLKFSNSKENLDKISSSSRQKLNTSCYSSCKDVNKASSESISSLVKLSKTAKIKKFFFSSKSPRKQSRTDAMFYNDFNAMARPKSVAGTPKQPKDDLEKSYFKRKFNSMRLKSPSPVKPRIDKRSNEIKSVPLLDNSMFASDEIKASSKPTNPLMRSNSLKNLRKKLQKKEKSKDV